MEIFFSAFSATETFILPSQLPSPLLSTCILFHSKYVEFAENAEKKIWIKLYSFHYGAKNRFVIKFLDLNH